MTITQTNAHASRSTGTIRITLKLFATLASYLPDGAKRNQIGI